MTRVVPLTNVAARDLAPPLPRQLNDNAAGGRQSAGALRTVQRPADDRPRGGD